MGGLLVLAVFFGWLAAAIWLARRISHAIDIKPRYRGLALALLSIVIFLLPVADELAARPSFAALCREGAVLKINAEKIRGKTVQVIVDPSNAPLPGMFIPILHSHVSYRDPSTGEVLAEYDIFQARGGLLSRAVPVARGGPLTGDYYCAPERDQPWDKRYGFAVLN